MAEDADRDEEKEEKPAKSGGSKLWIVIVAVNVVLVGGAAAFLLTKRSAAEPAPAAATTEGAAIVKTGAGLGPTIKMDPFIVNLNEPESNRYLKINLVLELSSTAAHTAAEARTTPIRDAVLMYLSGLTLADTQGAEGKEVIRKDLIERINQVLGAGAATRLYFSEFVVQ